MVALDAKRCAVAHACERHGVSQRRACKALFVDRSRVRNTRIRPDDAVVRAAMKTVAAERRRFGYRRIHIMLERQGIVMNQKKLRRLYREEKLRVRKRGGRKRALRTRRPMIAPGRMNERWSLDFVSDAFTDGRRFRVLAVVDDFTRECLALVADTSLSGARVVRELDAIIARRGRSRTIVSDRLRPRARAPGVAESRVKQFAPFLCTNALLALDRHYGPSAPTYPGAFAAPEGRASRCSSCGRSIEEVIPTDIATAGSASSFAAFEHRISPTMRQEHAAGDKVVDYSGKTIPIVDRDTGEIREAEIFVAVLGASNFTYAEAIWTQTMPDWIGSHVRMFRFSDGIPRQIVTARRRLQADSSSAADTGFARLTRSGGKDEPIPCTGSEGHAT